jgi:hypothetical protein
MNYLADRSSQDRNTAKARKSQSPSFHPVNTPGSAVSRNIGHCPLSSDSVIRMVRLPSNLLEVELMRHQV